MKYTARPLTPADWKAGREMRLLSLEYYGDILKDYHRAESRKPPAYWQDKFRASREQCFCGLFHEGKLIGVCAIRQWEESRDRTVAFGWSNFVLPEHRAHGAGRFLYKIRTDFAKKHGYRKLVIFTLDGEEPPMRNALKFGGKFLYTTKRIFDFGPQFFMQKQSQWHWWGIPLPARQRPGNAKMDT